MSRLRILTALMPVIVVLAASQLCFAESITLLSSGGGVYDYGLVIPSSGTIFDPTGTITLSGLSGVTGASVEPLSDISAAFAVSSSTPSSVEFIANVQPQGIGLIGPHTYGTLVVDSSVLTVGTVDFSTQTASGTVNGTTQGPVVSAVPEPTSLVLLGTAMLGLVGLARRRLLH